MMKLKPDHLIAKGTPFIFNVAFKLECSIENNRNIEKLIISFITWLVGSLVIQG